MAPDFCRPFDRDRQGFVLGEGAGVLVLERAETANARGADILAEVVVAAMHADAFHLTTPDPEGTGGALCLRAVADECVRRGRTVGHVSAHGTGTPHNDLSEARAIRTAFGSAADDIRVSSLKGLIGHANGAASALEAVACVLAVRDGVVPPMPTLLHRDPECDVRLVGTTAEIADLDVVVNNAFGFGGNCSCVAFGRWAA
jgi:3-oxoacyl-[acyl-carrier-protein] synthase II